MKDIPDGSVQLIVTDPPYNVTQSSRSFRNADGTVGFKGWTPSAEEWDSMTDEQYEAFTHKWLAECYRVLDKKGTIYVCIAAEKLFDMGVWIKSAGFKVLNTISWYKPNAFPYNYGKTRYCPSTEWVIFARKGNSHRFHYTEFLRDVWEYNTVQGNQRLHKHQKPCELIERMVRHSSTADDLVLDPFMGSGTSGDVCAHLGRSFIGIENDADTFATAQKRISEAVAHHTEQSRLF